MQYANEVWKKVYNSRYEASNYGRFRKLNKYNYSEIKTYRKRAICVVKLTINGKRRYYNVAKMIVELFIRVLKENEVVYHKNGIISDNRLANLEIITRSEAGRRTGWQSHRKAIIMLDKDGVIEKVFKGTREASKELFINRQTICDYCNKKVKKPIYNLCWADELI